MRYTYMRSLSVDFQYSVKRYFAALMMLAVISAIYGQSYIITASSGAGGIINPTGDVDVTEGSDQTFAITANTGYHIVDVLVDGVSAGAVSSYTFNNVTADHTIAASFAINTYTIAASSGAGGNINPTGDVDVTEGSDQTFAITASTGYHITDVLVDGVSAGAVSSYTFNNVTADHTIAASFAINTFTISASAGPNGSITPSGDQVVNYNDSRSFTITANTGYHIADVLVDGVSAGAVSSYTFNNVTADHTIAASFAINTYTIAASSGAGGNINPTGDVDVTEGSDQTFAITASTGYHIADVLVDGVSAGAVSSYTFNNVTTDHTISASFAINTFTISASAGPNGSITPSGDQVVNYNGSRSFTITASTGYHIADVLVDGVSAGAVSSYTFNNVTADHTISASFAINTYTISASAGPNGSITPSGDQVVNYNGSRSFTITANTGYHIADVLVDGVSAGAVSSYTFNNVTADHTIAASFAINTFTISASAGPNGSITPSGDQVVNYNGSRSFTITASTGYHIADVLVDGVSAGAVSSYTFNNVTADHTIAASFAINTYTISASAGPNGSITPSGDQVVNYNGSRSFTITASTGYHIADVLVDGVSAGAVSSYTFNNVTADHTISASFAINTYTIAASSGAGGNINPTGDVDVTEGSDQTFAITANTGYHIADVLVDGVSAGAVSSYTFNNVTADHTIAASFAINTFTISASAGPNGSITPSGDQVVNYNGSRSFAITASTGYHIADVLVDGVSAGAVSSYTFNNVTADHTIAASFAINTFTISASAGPNGSITPSGDQVVNYNGSRSFTITASTGYHIADVLVDGVSAGAVSSYTFNNVTADHTIAASFAINTYTIAASSGAGGNINPTGDVDVTEGSDQTFAITANTGYHIADVLVDGVSAGAVSSYTFNNVTADHTIAASFAINTFTISASAGPNGSITPSGDQVVNYNGSRSFAITASTGYHIADVLVDGVSAGAVSSYTFNNVTADHTIAASFAINTYTISASAGPNGSITPSGDQVVNYNGSRSFTITASTGYHIADVLVDGVSAGAVSSYTFNNVTADHTISASFAINTFTISASAGPNGSITPSGDQVVNYNGSRSFTITANTGYHIADVLVDGVSAGAVSSYTFNNVTADHTIAASFAINTFTISASAGPNGSITPSGDQVVNYNGSRSFAITASTGYHIADVLVDGVSAGAVSSYTFNNVTADHTIAASFAINTYTISASAGPNGSITPSGDQVVNYNGSRSFTITASTGYHIADVLVDGVSAGAVSSYTFNNVTADHTIAATFTQNQYTLLLSSIGDGSVTRNPVKATYVYGEVVQLTAVADPGWTFTGWSGALTGTTNPASITITGNMSVMASFTQDQYTLTVNTVGNGSVTRNPNQATYVYGDVVQLTATADPGWTFSGWSGGLSGSANPASVTISGNTTITATFTQNQYTLTVTPVGSGSVARNPVKSTYVYGEVVQLTATANPGWTFSGWSGGLSGTTNPASVTINGNTTVTATFTQDQYTLTVTPVGSGSVARNPVKSTYVYGEVVQLTATANPGWTFSSWSGGLTGSTNPASVTISGNTTVTATFTQNQYTLTVTPVGSGSVARNPVKSNYVYGEVVQLTATANPGWTFSSWSGDLSGSTNPASVTITGNTAITATFTQNQYTLSLSSIGDGSVTRNPVKATYVYGEVVQLTSTADPGWTFTGWSGALTGTTNPTSITITGNMSVMASFTQNQYTLTVSTVGNGSVTRNPNQATYVYGDVVQLTAVADPGWTFSGWSGGLTGSANPASVTITGNTSVTATFTQVQYTLSVSTVGNGSVTRNPVKATYVYGDVVQLTAVANPGWTFSGWSGGSERHHQSGQCHHHSQHHGYSNLYTGSVHLVDKHRWNREHHPEPGQGHLCLRGCSAADRSGGSGLDI